MPGSRRRILSPAPRPGFPRNCRTNVTAPARLFFSGLGWLVFDRGRWRREGKSDALETFLNTCVSHDPGGRIQAASLLETFNEWSRLNGSEPVTFKRLAAELERRGLRRAKSNAVWWLDIKLAVPPKLFGGRRRASAPR